MTAPVPPDFWQRVQMIADEAVRKYLLSGPLRNASITDGGLTIQNGTLRIRYPEELGGGTAVYYGNLYNGNTGDYLGTGMLVEAPDGTDIASFSWDSEAQTQTARLHDHLNNTIISNARDAGQGIGRPYLAGGGFYRVRYGDWGVTTTSTTFETLWAAEMFKQHPKLSVATRSSVDTSGATGEVRVLVDGVQLGDVETINFAQTVSLFGPADIDGAHMDFKYVEIQGRHVTGTGALRVEPLHLIGREF